MEVFGGRLPDLKETDSLLRDSRSGARQCDESGMACSIFDMELHEK